MTVLDINILLKLWGAPLSHVARPKRDDHETSSVHHFYSCKWSYLSKFLLWPGESIQPSTAILATWRDENPWDMATFSAAELTWNGNCDTLWENPACPNGTTASLNCGYQRSKIERATSHILAVNSANIKKSLRSLRVAAKEWTNVLLNLSIHTPTWCHFNSERLLRARNALVSCSACFPIRTMGSPSSRL